tara:strand:- start:2487 stop:2747 length:261 start_codon:yes stop_codon:yes gene_type:complete
LFRLIRTTTIKNSNQGLSSNGYVAVGLILKVWKQQFMKSKNNRKRKEQVMGCRVEDAYPEKEILLQGVLYRCICPLNKSSKTKPQP